MSYCIREGYRSRDHENYWDDTHLTDEWQREVYLMAATIMATHNYRRVYDVGCGSGWKLVHMLGRYETVGWDVPKTVAWLRAKYPGRAWRETPCTATDLARPDLVICADVIEHVLDPNPLLAFLRSMNPRRIIISTPDRDAYEKGHKNPPNGPPFHLPHVREWNFTEFRQYMDGWFNVLDHRQTGLKGVQPTQTAIMELLT